MDKIFILLLVVCIWNSCFNAVNSKTTTVKCRLPGTCPTLKLVTLRTNITLSCPVVGAGQTIIFMLRKVLSPSKKYILSGNNLTITNFTRADGGHYKCGVKNGLGRVVLSRRWIVMLNSFMPQPRPTLPSPVPFTTESLIGSSKAFNCWPKKTNNYLMYSKIQNTHKASKFSDVSRLRHNGGTYQIEKLGLNDSGFYYCGEQTSDGMKIWKILGELVVIATRIIYSKPKKGSPVQVGKMARFTCAFSGSSNFSWYKDGKKIIEGGKFKLMDKGKPGKKRIKLTINNVKIDDAGKYTCGMTLGGKTYGASTNLTVFAFRHVALVPRGPQDPKSSVNVTCENTENFQARVYFKSSNSKTFKRIVVDKKKYFEVAFNIISIVDLNKQDEGEYECRAKFNHMSIREKAGKVSLK